MKQGKAGYIEEVNIARGIAIFLAVFGHALVQNDGVQLYLFNFIYGFHMPLFVFISGYCNCGVLERHTKQEVGRSIGQRFCRLMIPYLSFGIVYVALDIIGGKYTLDDFDFAKYAVDLLKGDNANWQLWTLYVLFLCFVLTIVLKKWIQVSVLMIISAVLSTIMRILWEIDGLPSWLFYTIISMTLIYWFFFLFGVYCRKKWDVFRSRKASRSLLIIGIALLIVFTVIRTMYDCKLIVLVTAPLGIVLFSELSKYIREVLLLKRFFSMLGDYCMEIYIFANIFQVLTESIFADKLGVAEHLCVFISLTTGILGPILLCKYIINKIAICRFVFLGNLKKEGREQSVIEKA